MVWDPNTMKKVDHMNFFVKGINHHHMAHKSTVSAVACKEGNVALACVFQLFLSCIYISSESYVQFLSVLF